MPFCKNCGNKLDNDAAFCPNCGTPNSLSKNNTSKNLSSHQKEQTELNRESNNDAEDKTLQEESGKYGMNPTILKQGFILDNRYNIEAKLGAGGFGTVYKFLIIIWIVLKLSK